MTDTPPLRLAAGLPDEDDTTAVADEGFIFHSITHLHILVEKQQKREVQEHIVTHGKPPEDFPRFSAPLRVPIGRDHKGQPIVAHGEIPVHAKSVRAAFEMIPALFAEAVPNIQKEARKAMARQKLVIPGHPLIERFHQNGQEFRVKPEE